MYNGYMLEAVARYTLTLRQYRPDYTHTSIFKDHNQRLVTRDRFYDC